MTLGLVALNYGTGTRGVKRGYVTFQYRHSKESSLCHSTARLSTQLQRVFAAMSDGQWHTLDELVSKAGGTTASISARLRDFRKPKFGSHTVERQRKGDPKVGVYQYRLHPGETP